MQTLTINQVMRDSRKNRNAAIIILNGLLMTVICIYRFALSEEWTGKILMAISFMSYIILMIGVLHTGSKINEKHLSIIRDRCIRCFKETSSFSTSPDTNMGRPNQTCTLTFESTGDMIVLPGEFDAVNPGKEYYIVSFAHNKDIAKFYPVDEWELDETLKSKLESE